LSLLNSTVSGNSSLVSGGGIYNAGGSATLDFTTVYSNSGAAVEAPGGTVTAKNSIIAGSGTACSGSVSGASGGNYSDDTSCPSFTTVGQIGVTGLNTLDPASPAVDGAIDCTTMGGAIVGDDQFFTTRPQDNTGSGMGTCDAGSFELPSQF
jgi:hypothetical protein